jgi:DNA-binding IclR family transcriptional regulator
LSLIAPSTGQSPRVRLKRPSDRRSLSRSAPRALDVLECFGSERRPLRAIELARTLGLQGSTTNQLLKTMVDSGHLVFDARAKKYFPSFRLIGFSNLISDAFGGTDRLRVMAKELRVRTGLAVSLTTPNGLFMQILHIEMPDEQKTERGLRIGLFGSAIGSVYLSSLRDEDIARLAAEAGVARAELAEVLRTAHEVREDGYADGSGPDDTFWTLAMVLPQDAAPMPLVIAVAGERRVVQSRAEDVLATMREGIAHWFRPPRDSER